MSAATNLEFAEVEREARERLGKLGELVASYPAEMKVVVRALLPKRSVEVTVNPSLTTYPRFGLYSFFEAERRLWRVIEDLGQGARGSAPEVVQHLSPVNTHKKRERDESNV